MVIICRGIYARHHKVSVRFNAGAKAEDAVSETRFLIRRFFLLKSWGWMSHCNIWGKGPPELKLDDRLSRYIRQMITKFQLHSTLLPKLRACCVRNHQGHFQQARRDVTFFAALCFFLLRYVFLCEIKSKRCGVSAFEKRV